MRPSLYIADRPADELPGFLRGWGLRPTGQVQPAKALPAHLAALLRRPRPTVARRLSCRSTIRAWMAAWAAACRWASCTRSARRGWRRRPPRCPRRSSPPCWRASPRPGRCSGSPPSSDLHPPGLLPYGFDPNRLVLVRPAKDVDTLAAMEVALREGVAAAVVGEVGQFDRTASRRLQLACLRHGSTGFVLRRWPHGHRTAGPGGQRRRHPLASHPGAQREGRQGARPAALACGADACPRRPAGRMDHGGFG